MAIVTISRMYGSGGSDIAARVAQSLGWSLLDNAFVDAVAERLGVPRDEISAREERVPSLAERLANAMALGSPEMMPPLPDTPLPPSEERIIEVTRRVVEEAIGQGPVVLVGRGAQSMLAAREDTIHVFCYAPKPALVARAARRLNVSAEEAERIVDETNRNREQYVKKHWNRSWKAHENYHLCVNTEWLGIAGAAQMIVRLAQDTFGQAARPN
ncbi:MAG TPA: cytidylate kinase-like family protein [Gemmatimonadaceae bacterium]|nr:cytidylate kinase-like family protein [Gemmatimonadaceae bacterium]